MYENADKVIALMNKEFIKLFRRLKSLSFDEMNVMSNTKQTYDKADRFARKVYRELVKKVSDDVYDMYSDDEEIEYSASRTKNYDDLLNAILNGYSPTLKYVYSHEVERKRSRCAESIIASAENGQSPSKEVDTALRLWTNMTSQYADDIEWEATVDVYKGLGFDKVRWITEKDERVCKVCKERDNKIYNISNIPYRPHIGCRCSVVPVKEK